MGSALGSRDDAITDCGIVADKCAAAKDEAAEEEEEEEAELEAELVLSEEVNKAHELRDSVATI